MGYAFTYPLAALAGCTVASYTHYPTLSADMVRKVSARTSDFNNATGVSASGVRTQLKLLYYRLFGLLYRCVGHWPRLVMVRHTRVTPVNHSPSLDRSIRAGHART